MHKNNSNARLPVKDNTCAIITVYLPGSEVLDNLDRIMHQVNQIILIVNRCDRDILLALTQKLSNPASHSITTNSRNMGLAHALNQGIEIACSNCMEWALLLDQDTAVDDNIIEELMNTVSAMPKRPALVGSNYRNGYDNTTAFPCSNKNNIFETKTTIITSGTLLNLTNAKQIGPFRSEYFIDSIDHEYCMRARSLDYDIYITCKPLMTHSIGLRETSPFRRLHCLLSQPHAPERKYYIARNTLATALIYLRKYPLWSLRQMLRIPAELLATLLFEEKKLQRIRFTLSGILHGLILGFPPGPLESPHGQD